jgi:uncharacterized phage protein (TIGR02218 family)
MAGEAEARDVLIAHLAGGVTTVCRCWEVVRKDGQRLGFTDHDRELAFDGMTFSPQAGLEAAALVQTTGLAVDNSEGVGVLSDAAITEADILAGRYDGAAVRSWLVNWAEPDARLLAFRGTIGEVRRTGGAFRAELRGLTEALNQPQGFVYQRTCSAVLGDARCGLDMEAPGLGADLAVVEVEEGRLFRFAGLDGFAPGWFARGRLRMTGGAAAGLVGLVKADRAAGALREIELWQELRAPVVAGDALRLEAGCDRRAETCRDKFGNFANFRGFPHIPGEDWLMSYPKPGTVNGGASRYFPITSLPWYGS